MYTPTAYKFSPNVPLKDFAVGNILHENDEPVKSCQILDLYSAFNQLDVCSVFVSIFIIVNVAKIVKYSHTLYFYALCPHSSYYYFAVLAVW